MKVVYLENLSTITMIESLSSDLGSPMMKSLVTLSHERSAIGSGSNRPSRLSLLHLVLLAHKKSPHIGLNFIPYLRLVVS